MQRGFILKGHPPKSIGKPWRWFVAGGLLGYFLIHPLVMIAGQIMSASLRGHSMTLPAELFAGTTSAFSLSMLPWSLGFAVLSGCTGLLWARIRQVRMQKIRLQTAMELAGAACHELNQPMQVVSGYAELLRQEAGQAETLRRPLHEIIAQVDKMADILKKINNITAYETREYIDGIKIVDLEKSSSDRALSLKRKETSNDREKKARPAAEEKSEAKLKA